MEGGRSANYWPGFVDALTNVVIAMVFVIVVLAIALSFAAQMMGKKMADELVKAKAALAAAVVTAAPAERPTESSSAIGPPTTQPIDKTIEVHARSVPAVPPAELKTSARSLRLEFADTAVALDADASGKLRSALAPQHGAAANTRVQITATGPSMALSDNQRTAYIRVLAVRNELLDEGFTTENIAVLIDTAGTATKPTVTVSFPPSRPPSNTPSATP